MSEVLPFTSTLSVTRVLTAGTVINARSVPPEEGPHTQMLGLTVTKDGDPTGPAAEGVEIEVTVSSDGTYHITAVPISDPFDGRLTIG